MDSAAPIQLTFVLDWRDWLVVIAYLAAIVPIGMWFGRFTKSTQDFFLGGQRFSWWVGAVSCVATLVGSYSFLQYSQNGFNFGLSSMTAYTNDWFVLPLFVLVWLPIIYYSRLTSIPEYFERRFDRRTRVAVLLIILVYLQGYIGINLYSIGVALHGMLGWNITLAAAGVSLLTGLVIYAGGATSVMMADLLQAFLLLAAGILVFVLGIGHLGGFQEFWSGLDTPHRLPFARFNNPPEFHFIGDFWSDAITGTIAFYFINQSVLMRILSVKSVHDARKTMLCQVLVLMPIAAIAVSGAGWIGYSMVSHGMLDAAQPDNAKNIFMTIAGRLCPPGVRGFVMAAVLAALMSTLEALINAVSAVAVNDIWKPILRPGQSDAHYLRTARYVAVTANILGILMIPLFHRFASIYQALTTFNGVVTPPLVVVIVLGATWKRFTPAAAFWTLILGWAAVLASVAFPVLIEPFAHGEPATAGHGYMRSLFGLVVSGVLGVTITPFTRPRSPQEIPGLVMSTITDGMRLFKGGEPSHRGIGSSTLADLSIAPIDPTTIRLSHAAMEELQAEPGDLLYLADSRWWLGGLRSVHVKAGLPHELPDVVQISRADIDRGNLKTDRPVRVEKLM